MIPYEMRPLRVWNDPRTLKRATGAVFKASWDSTVKLLAFEAAQVGARRVVVQVDVREGEIRQDGMLYARAHVSFPGVVVSFESKYGPLRYATDNFEDWRANVRAIALGLQALRAVDRYGVTKRGEQYQGWKQLPAGNGSAPFSDAVMALKWMRHTADDPAGVLSARDLYRLLARRLHPDVGGSEGEWAKLDAAKQLITKAGMLE